MQSDSTSEVAGAGELFMSRRGSLGRKSIKFSLFAEAEALLHQTTADTGPAGGLTPNGLRKCKKEMLQASRISALLQDLKSRSC